MSYSLGKLSIHPYTKITCTVWLDGIRLMQSNRAFSIEEQSMLTAKEKDCEITEHTAVFVSSGLAS